MEDVADRGCHGRRTVPAWWCRRVCALAAVCAMLAVSACGQSSREKKEEEAFAHGHIYTSTPAGAAAILTRLGAPPGFTRADNCHTSDSACFVRRRSIILDDSEMIHLVMALGVAIRPATVMCTPVRHRVVPRLSFVACAAQATVGKELLSVSATSVVVATATGTRSSTRGFRAAPGGSTVEVTDIGH
jgi:hypothetical protein